MSLAEVQEFVLVPLHTAPNEAVAEIDALYDVYLDVIDKWGTDVSRSIWVQT